MAKLYIFSIGGTGSRVLRSLAMLLASGNHKGSCFDTIVPILLDPDAANGDLQRTHDILQKYQDIQEHASDDFFGVRIRTLNQLAGSEKKPVAEGFRFYFGRKADKSFRNYIGYSGLDESNQALVDLLFSKKTLDANMEVGFRGNPNMGSIVLNQFAESDEFQTFYSSFNNGDAVFIISSIFGGTGAAGFPLLLKNLRKADGASANASLVSHSIIGAVTLLPYFKVNPGAESQINSTTFIQKTRAALAYYTEGITSQNGVNLFYYLGDQAGDELYDNYEGGANQQNKAHFLELAAALGIIDFMRVHNNLPPEQTNVKEFGIERNTRHIHLNDLGNKTFEDLTPGLARFYLMKMYMDLGFGTEKTSNVQWQQARNKGITSEDLSSGFTESLTSMLEHFYIWLREMQDNDVSFRPFYLDKEFDNALEFIRTSSPKKNRLGRRPVSLKWLDEYNVQEYPGLKKVSGYEERLIMLFEQSTKKLMKEKFKMV